MNKPFLSRLFLLLCVAALSAQSAQSTQNLFVIERNTNSNRVYYEAKIAADSLLDARQPIHAYWIMWQKDPSGKTREELTLLEYEKAFGFRVKHNPARKFVWFSITPLPDRPIKVTLQKEGAVAETVIDGKFSVLEKVCINSTEKNFLPHVNYIELFGRNVRDGDECYERIMNR
jgi:hypothetical protein